MRDFIGDGVSGAIFDETRQYRFSLWRRWGNSTSGATMCAFVGLNPSTADENLNDPTIRRCIQFAKDWQCSGLVMLNIFAFRATLPKVMKAALEPVGAENDEALSYVSSRVGMTVCAWGTHGVHRNRGPVAKSILTNSAGCVWHLGLTKHGHPAHPLYLKSTTEPIIWS